MLKTATMTFSTSVRELFQLTIFRDVNITLLHFVIMKLLEAMIKVGSLSDVIMHFVFFLLFTFYL